MTFQIMMKTPHAVGDRIASLVHLAQQENGTDNERELEIKLEKFLAQFFKYEELITLEFNTDNNTATVVRC